jgi:pilus assembly protein CpaF
VAEVSLSERIQKASDKAAEGGVTRRPQQQMAVDGLAEFKRRIQTELFERMGQRLFETSDEEHLRAAVVEEISGVLEGDDTPLSPEERTILIRDIARDVMGLGPIEPLIADPTITEVMVNGTNYIYVERAGVIEATRARFLSEDHLQRVIDRIVGQVGRRIDESSPMVDARLIDGSRVNAIVPPLSLDGPILTIRKFAKDPFQVADLVRMGSFTDQVATLLHAAVKGGLNVLVSGGTGTGKTTLLNVLSSFVPGDERIVTIEDAVELQLHQHHVIRLEARPPNIEGAGEVTIRDLVRNALRMRPDRIIVGEVRGAEALDMLQAMNTGHDGSLSTVHANSPRDALARVETMVLMAGFDLPSRAVREQISSALDLVIHIDRFRDGTRRVVSVSEVIGMEGEVVTMQDVFRFDYQQQRAVPTGIRPQFADHLAEMGVPVSNVLFSAPLVGVGGQ